MVDETKTSDVEDTAVIEAFLRDFCVEYDIEESFVREILGQYSQRYETREEIDQLVLRRTRDELEMTAELGALVDELVNTVIGKWGNAPWKTGLHRIENKHLRKILNERLRLRREKIIHRAIEEGTVSWEAADKVEPTEERIGVGCDERVIELPIAIEMADLSREGMILDAGSALNLPQLRPYIVAGRANLTHFTQSGDREICDFEGSKISYQFGDLRDLPYRSGVFDRVLCISSLEHIGMDNSRYGAPVEHDKKSHRLALREMYRVVRPSGYLFVTIPYGQLQDRGWYQVFSEKQVEKMVDSVSDGEVEIRYYVYDGGWRPCKAGDPALVPMRGKDQEYVSGVALLRVRKPAEGSH